MNVTVYSTKTCPYCVKLKQWLVSHDIEFSEVYIDSDAQAVRQMIEISGQMSVPFTTITTGEDAVVSMIGYDEVRLQAIFGIS